MKVGMGSLTDVVTSQVGGAQDPCTAGGLLCPQPQSFGSSFNPCCWSSSTSSTPITDAQGNVEALSSIPAFTLVAAISLGAFFVIKEMR